MKYRRRPQYVNAVMFRAPVSKSVSSPILSEEDLKATKSFKEYPEWLVKAFLDGTLKFRCRESGAVYLKIQYLGDFHCSVVDSGDYLVRNSRGRLEAWSREAFKEAYQHIRKPKNELERSK